MQKQTRWKYYIDKEFQNHFIFGFSAVLILNAILVVGIVWLLRSNPYSLLPDGASVLVQVDANKAVGLSVSGDGKVILDETGTPYFPLREIPGKPPRQYNAFDLYIEPILIVSLLNLIVIIGFSLFFSHRMAGPIHRIKVTLEEFVANQKPSSIRLRKKDHFSEVADLLNKALKLEDRK
ncbi:MAG: hypothetical protein K8R21_12205 [Leptospira sp.]|nr:hypothetical protein [Leptospira sp.]